MLGLHQFVDQTGRGGKSYPPLLPACRYAESSEQMGLAGAAFADEKEGFGPINVAAFGQVAHFCRHMGLSSPTSLIIVCATIALTPSILLRSTPVIRCNSLVRLKPGAFLWIRFVFLALGIFGCSVDARSGTPNCFNVASSSRSHSAILC